MNIKKNQRIVLLKSNLNNTLLNFKLTKPPFCSFKKQHERADFIIMQCVQQFWILNFFRNDRKALVLFFQPKENFNTLTQQKRITSGSQRNQPYRYPQIGKRRRHRHHPSQHGA